MTWDDFDFWRSGEWQVITENLDDLDAQGRLYNPSRNAIFTALDAVKFEDIRACIIGQDPYPDRNHATGLAFSIPNSVREYPPTLLNVLSEYQSDLHYPAPRSGNLESWCKQGVLLWNCFPVCRTGDPGSLRWPEWDTLNREILVRLLDRSEEGKSRPMVVVLLGSHSRKLRVHIPSDKLSLVIETSHPSPRGNINSKTPFLGSRVFTRVNALLCEQGAQPIDWRLS